MKTPVRRITKQYYDYYHKKYLKMLMKISFKYSNSPVEFDECCDVAFRELLYAMIYYKKNSKTLLTTYVYARVSGKIFHANLKEKRYNGKVTNIDNFFKNSVKHIDLDHTILINELLSCLDPIEKYILQSYYMQNQTLKETAKQIGMSFVSVHKMKDKAIKKIKKNFPDLFMRI